MRSGRFSTFFVAGSYWRIRPGRCAQRLAGGGGDVFADLEFGTVGLSEFQVTLAGGNVLGQHAHAAYQVFAIARHRLTVELGIGEQEI